jgi:hypothetical protein
VKRPAAVILYAWLYLGWFACVLLGKYDASALSLLVPAAGWLLFWRVLSPKPRDCLKVLVLCLAGACVDAAFMKWGLVRYVTAAEIRLLPLWMISLWLLFAPAIYVFAGLFAHRLWLAAIAGGILGPLSYKSGEVFGVLELSGLEAVLVYAAFWATFLPLAIGWVRRSKTS